MKVNGNDMRLASGANEVSYDPFAGLLPEQRELLLRIAEEEEVRRSKIRKPAAAWLSLVVGSDDNSKQLLERLGYLGLSVPALGDFPDFERTLGYALASETLETSQFTAYTTSMEYYYWVEEQELKDMAALTKVLWSLPSKVSSVIAPQWYRHILRNVLPHMWKDHNSELPQQEEAAIFLEKITAGKLKVVMVDDLEAFPGLLFTGPRVSTMVVDNQEQEQFENKVVSHLLAHFLLGHVDRARFQMWVESMLPIGVNSTLEIAGKDPDYELSSRELIREKEAEAEVSAECLLQPAASAPGLSNVGRILVRPFLEVGVPSDTVRFLFDWRGTHDTSLMELLLRPLDSVTAKEQKIRPGMLVFGSNRHVYLIDKELKKREVHSEEILDSCIGGVYVCKGTFIHRISDEKLNDLAKGPPVLSVDEAEEIGLCHDCDVDNISADAREHAETRT